LQVSPEKEIVWTIGQYELPGIQLSWVATLTERPSGNIVISNCFAGPHPDGGLHAGLIEVDHETKEVVWTFSHGDVYHGEMSTGDTAVSQVLEGW
jgi:hypothetical protein